MLRGAKRRGNPFFSCKETDSHASDAVTGVGMTGSGTSGTPSPTGCSSHTGTSGCRPLQRLTAPIRRGRCPHIAPPDKCAFCGGTHGSRPTGYAGHAGRDVGDAVPYNGSPHPSAEDDAHIVPPAAQRGRRKRLPACRKSPDGLFRQAGRQNRKIKTTFYFAILVAAAGDWTRKGTLTVPFHTILPSDICNRTGSLTG